MPRAIARVLPAIALACATLGLGATAAPATALAAGTAGIAGTVTSADTALPVPGIEVCARSTAEPLAPTCAITDEKGEYAISGLAEGNYHVEFSAPEGSGLNYLPQFYSGKAHEAEAEPVSVVEGAVTPAIDAALEPGGEIAGTVTSAATKKALAGVRVCAREALAEVERCAKTAADGTYLVAALPAGGYRVQFTPFEAGSTYAPQYFKDAEVEAEAEAVAVTLGATTAEIDAVMQGVPVALLKPAIVGRAVEGQTLSYLHGTWTNSPTTMTEEWGRCDATGEIGTCHTISTASTYTLGAEDVGHTLRIRETAVNAFGAGVPPYLFSPPTAVVVEPAAPAPPSASPPAAGPAPPVASGVLPSIARAATAAQLKALLASLLAPHGRNARIGALLRHRGYTVSFASLAAGKLSISWYLVPKGARVARAKPTLVARGVVSTKASGASRLKIALSARGRKLLKAGKRLKLTAKGVLTASGRPSLSATRKFTLKR
jgi:hypothetical protein